MLAEHKNCQTIFSLMFTDEEKDLITDCLRQRIREIVMITRNNELTVANPALSCQFSEKYIKALKEVNIPQAYKDVKTIKNLVNKIHNRMFYKEDDLIQIGDE